MCEACKLRRGEEIRERHMDLATSYGRFANELQQNRKDATNEVDAGIDTVTTQTAIMQLALGKTTLRCLLIKEGLPLKESG